MHIHNSPFTYACDCVCVCVACVGIFSENNAYGRGYWGILYPLTYRKHKYIVCERAERAPSCTTTRLLLRSHLRVAAACPPGPGCTTHNIRTHPSVCARVCSHRGIVVIVRCRRCERRRVRPRPLRKPIKKMFAFSPSLRSADCVE